MVTVGHQIKGRKGVRPYPAKGFHTGTVYWMMPRCRYPCELSWHARISWQPASTGSVHDSSMRRHAAIPAVTWRAVTEARGYTAKTLNTQDNHTAFCYTSVLCLPCLSPWESSSYCVGNARRRKSHLWSWRDNMLSDLSSLQGSGDLSYRRWTRTCIDPHTKLEQSEWTVKLHDTYSQTGWPLDPPTAQHVFFLVYSFLVHFLSRRVFDF